MTYSYICEKCSHSFDLTVPSDLRDEAVKRPCPSCKKKGVERQFEPLAISYEGVLSPTRRAGSGWNDVLKKISKGAGRRSKVIHD